MPSHDDLDVGRLERADALGNQLVLVSRLLAQRVPEWVRDSGMEGAGFRLLARLVVVGPQRVGELASAFELDRTTVTRQLAELKDTGLIEQQADPSDRRAQISTTTPRGVQQFRAVRQRRSQSLDLLLRDWPGRDVQTLVELLQRLTKPHALPFEPFTADPPSTVKAPHPRLEGMSDDHTEHARRRRR